MDGTTDNVTQWHWNYVKQCLRIKRIPQRKIGITFCVVVRFWCPIAEMKATVMPLHMLLDLSKNIYFSKSYSRKLFVIKKTQLDFLKIFWKNFWNFRFSLTFQQKNRKKWFLEKSKCWIFWNVFWKYFLKIEFSFFYHNKFSAVTFGKINNFI